MSEKETYLRWLISIPQDKAHIIESYIFDQKLKGTQLHGERINKSAWLVDVAIREIEKIKEAEKIREEFDLFALSK